MFDYTSKTSTLFGPDGLPCTIRQARDAFLDETEAFMPFVRFSSAYGTSPVEGHEPLCALLYHTGYPRTSAIPVYFNTAEKVLEVYNLLADRPIAWLYELLGWSRPTQVPPTGLLLPAVVASARGRDAHGVSQLTVSEINACFFMLALRSPGVWHGKLSRALGVPLTGRKTQLFRGHIVGGHLVPRRYSDEEIILRPVRNR